MKLWQEEKSTEPGLRFTSDKEILEGIIDKPSNALIYYIGNYPPPDVLSRVDVYAKSMKPPNSMWDKVVRTGNPKDPASGWASTGFASTYMEFLVNDNSAYAEAMHTKARAKVRPIYIAHHNSDKSYSPASVCIDTIQELVELPIEREDTSPAVTYRG